MKIRPPINKKILQLPYYKGILYGILVGHSMNQLFNTSSTLGFVFSIILLFSSAVLIYKGGDKIEY